ncbi:hypothetical protein ACFLYB_07390 [Chloroflexota bacterium]
MKKQIGLKKQIRILGLLLSLVVLSTIIVVGSPVSACPPQETWFESDEYTITASETITFIIMSVDGEGNDSGTLENFTKFEIDSEAGGSWNGNEYTPEVPGTWKITGHSEFVSLETTETIVLHSSATLTVLPGQDVTRIDTIDTIKEVGALIKSLAH